MATTASPFRTSNAIGQERVHIVVQGAVQGVGFRPFIFKLATSLNLVGWVNNTEAGVIIEAEGPVGSVRKFLTLIEEEKPDAAIIQSLEPSFLNLANYSEFKILDSQSSGAATTIIMADLATCRDCLSEMANPLNRRYRYPFTNCTNCGPRYSIILDLPYDRPNTTMRGFTMCDACRVEYDDPLDRRFHAQPIACPHCGPQVALWDESGKTIATRNDAILLAAEKIKAGAIIALKGIGGFQLLVDATSEEAVLRLRRRKQREEKPFAVMYPSLSDAERDCEIGDLERRLLRSGQSPIVLVHQKPATRLAPSVAPRNPDCGVLIPYSPLHHLLLQELASPVVATSGNLSEDPICIDEGQALTTLKEIADFYLVHDRPIQRHVDDSVVRIVAGREMVLRRARGYAPLPVALDGADAPILAVGAHQKSSIALSVGPMAIVSQHIGDLNTLATWNVFKAVTEDLSRMYQHKPVAIACDLHPDYRSGTFRTGIDLDIIPVQHHYAHVLSCMADNHVTGDVLGIAWDGTGYGTDSTIWGGEFLKVGVSGFERFSSLFPFRLPGGEASIHEPRRTALGILFATYGTDAIKMSHLPPVASFSANEIKTIETMICHGTNTPITSSMGRLFDGIAAILGIRQHVRHEGQAAMDLENLARKSGDDIVYEMPLKLHDGKLTVDWRPMLAELIEDLRRELAVENIARRFHNTLAHMAVTVANAAQIEQVALSGGCFQNRLLTETCIDRLRSEGYTPYWHQRVPPNDGGISLGQLVAATRQRADKRVESERLCV